MKHGKRKFLLSILLGVLVAAMAVLSGCKARTEPKSDPGAGNWLPRNMKQKQKIRWRWQRNWSIS